ncbi:MAG: DUF2155 domain-containing protein [Deltaproteobacteria bacterium]|nr:DUF2155 domain-containing protein [Deltaproteobacteria bacterium]MBW2020934.1 DUF2155 domain-containing protein [Deltaproteobacteria bacterium]MBW2075725.1 DUF2155 domain-containing protein [Deltaproteobacteria bacterium]RLB79585.1 MAG: hypothetical protein DRH17_13540 [Deltaproteobacteria bacterium]
MAILRKIPNFIVAVIVLGVLFGLGCQKKEDIEKAQKEPVTPIEPSMEKPIFSDKKQVPPADMGRQFPKEMLEALGKMHPERSDSPPIKKGHTPVVVPQDVQSKWKAVVLEVANKETGEQKDYVVDINQALIIPNTKIKIDVLTFLPDFSMSPEKITSVSNKPRNPAAKVVIYEDSHKIFEGWLFQKLPSVHSFQHKVYAVKLKGQKSA